MQRDTRLKTSAGVAALFCVFVGGWEGLRTKAYKDIVGIPTVCYGETRGVKLGDSYTPQQCKEMLLRDSDPYATAVETCITAPLSGERYVAFVSLAYNVGPQAMCKSTAVRLLNQGRTREACEALMNFVQAGKGAARRTVTGLVNRRKAERELCLKGL